MAFLTNRQAEVMRFISEFIGRNHYPPSVREVATAMDVTPNGAQCHLTALAKKGQLTRTSGIARSIRVLDKE